MSADDRRQLVQVVRWLFWLLFVVQEAKLSLKRLRRSCLQAVPPPQEESSEVFAVLGEAERGQGVAPAEASAEASRPEALSQPDDGGEARRGGGPLRRGCHGAAAYAGAERVACRHEELREGEVCPVCGQGRLYAVPPGVELRIDGNALLSAIRYELEKLRCSRVRHGVHCRAARGGRRRQVQFPARAVLAVVVTIWPAVLPPTRLSSDAGGTGARCNAVGPDREGGRL